MVLIKHKQIFVFKDSLKSQILSSKFELMYTDILEKAFHQYTSCFNCYPIYQNKPQNHADHCHCLLTDYKWHTSGKELYLVLELDLEETLF